MHTDLTPLTAFGLFFVTGGATLLGSLPVFFHKYLKDAQWNWWESFGGGVMVSASIFSLFLPALRLVHSGEANIFSFASGLFWGVALIWGMSVLLKRFTKNIAHQKAYLFVFVMGLHNVPEGLAVGLDVAAVGWIDSLPLSIAIFIQNLPEGLVSSMTFLISGFSVRQALIANGITAIIEAASALISYQTLKISSFNLSFLFSFAGSCMITVVALEVWKEKHGDSPATFSPSGFITGLLLCGALDFLL